MGKKNFNSIFRPMLAVILIFGGFLLIFWAGRDKLVGSPQFIVRSSQNPNYSQAEIVEVKPYKLYIPKIHKTLLISDGVISNDRWMISDTGVSYLTTSPLPGKMGNAVLYGHNLDSILGKLPSLNEGDLVYVVMNDGTFYKYAIFERKQVEPDAVGILKNSGDFRITIYTCSGFLDSARYVVVGKLVDG